jgi:hypothetical protein
VLGAVGLEALRSGALLLPYNSVTWTPGLGTEGRMLGLRLARSDDDGATWTAGSPVDIDFFWPAVYGQILEFDDGELLWPVWGRLEQGQKWRSTVLSSTDSGHTWVLKGTVAFDPKARLRGDYVDTGNSVRAEDPLEVKDPNFRPHDPTDGFTETSVLELADGRLLAILRQQGVGGDQTLLFFRAYSSDRGSTWTPYESVGFGGMSPALATLADGSLLLAYRRCAPPGSGLEPGVDLRVGSADGERWGDATPLESPRAATLDGEYQCGYPTIVDDGAGVLVFFYTFDPVEGRYVAWNRVIVSSDETEH